MLNSKDWDYATAIVLDFDVPDCPPNVLPIPPTMPLCTDEMQLSTTQCGIPENMLTLPKISPSVSYSMDTSTSALAARGKQRFLNADLLN